MILGSGVVGAAAVWHGSDGTGAGGGRATDTASCSAARSATRRPLALVLADDVIGCVAGAYYFTAVAQHLPELVTIVLVGTWVIRMAAGMPGWAVAYCIGMALIGPAVEATLSELGLFHYHHPELDRRVARWLPALYLYVGRGRRSRWAGGADEERPAAPELESVEIEVTV